jgi:hypothetical protein
MSASGFSDFGNDKEVLKRFGELETQRKEAGEIVYKWFRYRARRNIGIFYSLVSFFPVLGTILSGFSVSSTTIYIVMTVATCTAVFVARLVGMQNFGMMRTTISLLKENSKIRATHSYFEAASYVILVLWPWFGFMVAASLHVAIVAILFALTWLVELVFFRIVVVRRNKNPIIDLGIADHIIVFAFPLAAIFSVLGVLPNSTWFSPFLLITPLVLFAGVKSLYDAPKELAGNIVE